MVRAPGIGSSRIGRYKILRRVGAGGMGVVYEATDSRTSERVAVKVLWPHAAEEEDGLLRFKREFRALARLRHPNIVRVLDAGIEDDVPFIAMEFLEGRDVRAHATARPAGELRDRELRRCLRQIFSALAHVHAHRIVHRDLKPENVIVCEDGRVKVMDFGVAQLPRTPSQSAPGLLGTFAYMAPEQVLGRPVDGRSDLYAVGIFLYEILTGDYPFPVEPPAAALHHHVHTMPRHVLNVAPHADPTLASLTHRLLEKDPLDRLQTAEEAFPYIEDDGETGTADLALPGQLFAPSFVNRSREMGALTEFVDRIGKGRGGLLLLHGPGGVGKSRLMHELHQQIKDRVFVLQGQCAPERIQQDYYPFQTIFDEVEVAARRAPEELTQRIAGRDAALLRPVSPGLARLGGPARTEHLDAAERKARLHKAMVGVIGRLALTRPVLVVLEDVHWADQGTREVVWDASRTLLAPRPGDSSGQTVCPVGFLLTRRSSAEGPDTSETLIRRLQERSCFSALGVEPISKDGVQAMLRTMTGVRVPASDAVEELVRATRGRPLLVREVLEAWVSDGTLQREGRAWHFRERPLESDGQRPRSATSHDNPATSVAARPVSDVLARTDDVARARIGHLSCGARTLLERVAQFGRWLPANLVETLAEGGEPSFLDAIDELVRARILSEEVRRGRVWYRFQHEDFRAAVVRGLPEERRKAIHGLIAARIEKRFRRRRTELAPALSRHYQASGAGVRAIRYLSRMASQAADRGDLEGALRRLTEATRILDDRPRTRATATRRLRLLIRQIDLLLDFGRPAAALDRADPRAGLSARDPELISAELTLRRAAAQFNLGRLDDALATISTMPGRSPTRSIAARGLRLEGRIRMRRGEHARARTALQAAFTLATDASLDDLAHALDTEIAVVFAEEGEYDEALARLERGLVRARRREDPRAVARLLGHIGLVSATRGDDGLAEARLTEAVQVAQNRGFTADVLRWSGELGRVLVERGHAERAIARLKDAVDRAAEQMDRPDEAEWRRELGAAYLAAGRIERAAAELGRALTLTATYDLPVDEAKVRVALSALALESGYDRVGEAMKQVKVALDIARKKERDDLLGAALLQLGRVRRAQGDVTRAKETLRHAEVIARSRGDHRLLSRVRNAITSLAASPLDQRSPDGRSVR